MPPFHPFITKNVREILQAWREITVAFWDFASGRYDLFVSDETIRELQDYGYPACKRDQCLALVINLSCLALTSEVSELAAYYVQEGAMPSNPLMTWETPFTCH